MQKLDTETKDARAAPRPSRSPNPSGGRRWSGRHWQASDEAETFAGLEPGEDRFAVVRLLDRVGRECGWNGSLIRHLSLLIEYTRPGDWEAGHRPVVWLSVRETARKLGLSETQVRRNERRLLDLGAIAFRDSANHRRFGRRDGRGHIAEAYGIDLAPAARLLPGLTVLAETLDREREQWLRLKRELSAARRRLRAAVLTAVDAHRLSEAAADVLHTEIATLGQHVHDAEPLDAMRRRIADAERIETRLRAVVECTEEPPEPTAAASETNAGGAKTVATGAEKGCQANPSRLPPLDYTTNEPLSEHAAVATGRRKRSVVTAAGSRTSETGDLPPTPPELHASSDTDAAASAPRVSYDKLLAVVPPAMAALLPEARRPSWPELTDAAEATASTLGISRHAWTEACRVLGRQAATLAVVVIAARRGDGVIASPGGYLRAMTRRAQRGQLRLGASVHGLLERLGKER